jgi:apolipoprotein N-acyltransferase
VAAALGVTTLVHRADDAPSVLVIAALLLPLVVFFYTGLVAVLAQSRLGVMAWVQFGAGGVVTSAVMAWAVYRRHPAVRADWVRGRTEDA